MGVTAFIFARGGSKGLPDKNIRPLLVKPLIAWSIEQALAVEEISRVIVSTDSKKIARVAEKFGAEVPFLRPAELAADDSPELLAWRHGIRFLEESESKIPEFIVSVPATSPLREPGDIRRCIQEYEGHRNAVDVIVTVTDAHRNPYFNMVKIVDDGLIQVAVQATRNIRRRQDAAPVFDLTTVAYVARASFILENDAIFNGLVRSVHVPVERSIDIDTALDFDIAEFLMKRQLKANQ